MNLALFEVVKDMTKQPVEVIRSFLTEHR